MIKKLSSSGQYDQQEKTTFLRGRRLPVWPGPSVHRGPAACWTTTLMAGSALCRCTLFSIESSSCSESDSDEAANRVNFFFGGEFLSSLGSSAITLCSLTTLVAEAHTSLLSALGRHLRSLNLGSNAGAIFRYAVLAFPLRVSMSFLNVDLKLVT